jgi:ubiquinone/menaquinone biosynthesis C-methylase UbiE
MRMTRNIEEALFINKVRALAAGKMTSTMFELALEMRLFPKLHGREVTLEELAQLLGLPIWSARVMAQFLCREGLMVYSNKKLSNAAYISPYLVEENREENRELKELYPVLSFNLPKENLKQLLLDPPAEDGYERIGKEKHFLNVNVRRILWGEQLSQLYSFKGHRVLLDVAGASGGFLIGIRRHNPHLRCILFDLPEAEEFAQRCLGEAGESESVRFVGGSFLTDDLPRGADVALLSNVIHNWPMEQDMAILSRIYEALEPGGTLLVKEAFFEDDWTGHIEPLFQAFFMGNDTWQPTYGEVEEMMAEVGFVDLERRFDIYGLVIGRKQA